jgi:phosphate transport system substrate-binding protein
MNRHSGISRWLSAVSLIVIALLSGCGSNNPLQETDTPTTGRIRVGIDDSYRLMMDAQIYAFESFYMNAKIDTLYGSEADIINAFLKDTVPLMIVNRELTADELNFLFQRQYIPKTTLVAFDAVAFILNRENPDSNLYYEHIRDIFTGKITNWSQINPKSKLGEVKMVFDNYKSSNPRYFREKFSLDKLPASCYALNDNSEVINFVERNKNAIGVVSVNWISDRRDTVSNNFLKKVSVAGISNEGNNDPSATFYQPYQAYIAQGDYPFIRKVYCINRQSYSGLGYGFSAFIAGEKGQMILLHSGLVPATMPVRIVEVKH